MPVQGGFVGGGRGKVRGLGKGANMAISVNATCFLKARSCRDGLAPSEVVASGQFYVSAPSALSLLSRALEEGLGGDTGGRVRGAVAAAGLVMVVVVGVWLRRARRAPAGGGVGLEGRQAGDAGSAGMISGAEKAGKGATRGRNIRKKAGVGREVGSGPGGGGQGSKRNKHGGVLGGGENAGDGPEPNDGSRQVNLLGGADREGSGGDGADREGSGGDGGDPRFTTQGLKSSLSVRVPAGGDEMLEGPQGWRGEEGLHSGYSRLVSPASVPLALGSGVVKIGPMEVDTGAILGHGSHGTVVYTGTLHGRAVAVKRVLLEYVQVAEKEMDLLIASDRHPAIVRYFDRARDGAFVYLALELCVCTLSELVERLAAVERGGAGRAGGGLGNCGGGSGDGDGRGSLLKSSAADRVQLREPEGLADVVEGVGFLHGLGIAHRDLKPLNILVTENSRLKISDMGLSKRLEGEQSSFETLAGTWGWRAPEQVFYTFVLLSCFVFACDHRRHPGLASPGAGLVFGM